MTSRRRGRFWLPFGTGATPDTIISGNVVRLFIPSVLESEVGRELERYTIVRLILSIYLKSTSGNTVVTMGAIALQEDVLLTSIGPGNQPSADWLWHEEFLADAGNGGPYTLISRDIRSQRRQRGSDTDFYIYTHNRGANSVINHTSGRALCLAE